MSRRINLFLLFLLFCGPFFAQEIILFEQIQKPDEQKIFCKNCLLFIHPYISSRYYVPIDPHAEIRVHSYSSTTGSLGCRLLLKVHHVVSTGFNVWIEQNSFSIVQSAGNDPIDTVQTARHRVYFLSSGADVFLRLHLDKRRGMYLGHFIDLGYRGGLNFLSGRMIADRWDNGMKYRLWYRPYEEINAYQTALYMRAGINRFSILFQLQLIGWLNEGFSKNLPVFSAGFEMGIFD